MCARPQEAVGAAQRAAVERDIALRSRDEMMRELAGEYMHMTTLHIYCSPLGLALLILAHGCLHISK